MSDTERSKFLNHLVTGTRDILRLQQGLSEHSNYHEFCRLLGRLKTNYQLSELVSYFCTFAFRKLICAISQDCFATPHDSHGNSFTCIGGFESVLPTGECGQVP